MEEKQIYYIYALKSLIDNRIYVRFSNNINKRLKEHNSGKTKSTKGYKPWVSIYSEEVTGRETARQREKFLKGGSGKEWLKTKI